MNFKEEEEEDVRDEEDVDSQDVFGSAENFLIGLSERRNNNARNTEYGKVLNMTIETGQEETYEVFTLKEEDSETEEELRKENENSLLLKGFEK